LVEAAVLAVAVILTVFPALAERRIALVIGNSQYKDQEKLVNPPNDVSTIATALRGVGFDQVTVRTETTREELLKAIGQFSRDADFADWALVYFSGHGIQIDGLNYMIPVDAALKRDRDIDLEAVDLRKALNAVEGAKRLRIVVLDACRNNPFARTMTRSAASKSVSRGLASVEPAEAGTLVVFAAKDGQVALDGAGRNSPFAAALAKRIQQPNLEVRRLFDWVRDDVFKETNRQQLPFTYGSLSGGEDFYFVKTAAAVDSRDQEIARLRTAAEEAEKKRSEAERRLSEQQAAAQRQASEDAAEQRRREEQARLKPRPENPVPAPPPPSVNPPGSPVNVNGATIFANRGRLNFEQGLYDAAVKNYDQAIKLNPTMAAYYDMRCQAKLKLGQPGQEDCDAAKRLR
jgi:tetratricopeptide (TPR) repeat protein